jgi:hypothetical protein
LLRAYPERQHSDTAEQCDEIAPFQLIELHPLFLASVAAEAM